MGEELSEALIACHGQGVTHRDIKPDNVFVTAYGGFKLGDFGIARQLESSSGLMSTVAGTRNYMAPEVMLAKGRYDGTVDIYSLGLVLYQLANGGRLPFTEDASDADALERRFSGEPLPAPSDASPELARVVLKACAFNPQDRYQSAADLLEDLRRVERGEEPEAEMPATRGEAGAGAQSTQDPATESPWGKSGGSTIDPFAMYGGAGRKREPEPDERPSEEPERIRLTNVDFSARQVDGTLFVTARYGGQVLEEGVDYRLEYLDEEDENGRAIVRAVGIRRFMGTRTLRVDMGRQPKPSIEEEPPADTGKQPTPETDKQPDAEKKADAGADKGNAEKSSASEGLLDRVLDLASENGWAGLGVSVATIAIVIAIIVGFDALVREFALDVNSLPTWAMLLMYIPMVLGSIALLAMVVFSLYCGLHAFKAEKGKAAGVVFIVLVATTILVPVLSGMGWMQILAGL